VQRGSQRQVAMQGVQMLLLQSLHNVHLRLATTRQQQQR
jgi:hypothetical protein